MKKLINYLTARDKMLHFAAGTLIYLLAALFIPLEWALFAVFIIGAGKEAIYDMYLKKGNPEPVDYFMTVLPALLMFYILN